MRLVLLATSGEHFVEHNANQKNGSFVGHTTYSPLRPDMFESLLGGLSRMLACFRRQNIQPKACFYCDFRDTRVLAFFPHSILTYNMLSDRRLTSHAAVCVPLVATPDSIHCRLYLQKKKEKKRKLFFLVRLREVTCVSVHE